MPHSPHLTKDSCLAKGVHWPGTWKGTVWAGICSRMGVHVCVCVPVGILFLCVHTHVSLHMCVHVCMCVCMCMYVRV